MFTIYPWNSLWTCAGNNLINLCAYDEVKEALDELGFDLNVIEDQEPDPALGNGGLGRLAACFLDSLATLGSVLTAAVSVITMVCSNRRSETLPGRGSR